MAGLCIFCGTETEYLRDNGPYRLTPFCLDCVAPYGVTGRSDTGHLLDPEILDQFYCTQPDPLPTNLLVGVQTKVASGRVWIATTELTLNEYGAYEGFWKTASELHGIHSVLEPSGINWVSAKRPPRAGQTWKTTSSKHPEVTLTRASPYEFLSPDPNRGGALVYEALPFSAFVRQVKTMDVPHGHLLKHVVETTIRFRAPPPPLPPDHDKAARAIEHRQQILNQLDRGLTKPVRK
jgi:hypothetical protein